MNAASDKFKGFPKETPDFLFNIKFYNTTSKEKENLAKYKILISEPLKQLYKELLPTVLNIDPRFETKQSRCVSTPYTDRRFSPSAPLKEYMYIRFKYSDLSDNIPGLYFDMGCDYYSYGLRIYKQNIKGMDKIREKILKAPEHFSSVLDKLSDKGFFVIGDLYKKDKLPNMPDCPAKSLYNRKSFYIGKDVKINENIFSRELAEEIKANFLSLTPIIRII